MLCVWEHQKKTISKLICPGFIQTNVAINAIWLMVQDKDGDRK
jgi:hypothetical protein